MVYCSAVEVGQYVYLRYRPPGRNKIQDAWSFTMYKVVEVQGSIYAVQPIEGGPIKRVHRSNIRPCVNKGPVPAPRIRKPPVKKKPTSVLEKEMPPLDVECVLVEEVQSPREAPVLNAALKDMTHLLLNLKVVLDIRGREWMSLLLQDLRVERLLLKFWKQSQSLLEIIRKVLNYLSKCLCWSLYLYLERKEKVVPS